MASGEREGNKERKKGGWLLFSFFCTWAGAGRRFNSNPGSGGSGQRLKGACPPRGIFDSLARARSDVCSLLCTLEIAPSQLDFDGGASEREVEERERVLGGGAKKR